MEITTKMKIAAVGLAALLSGCNNPVNEQQAPTIYIPKECAQVKSLVHDGYNGGWSLTCTTEQGTDRFYSKKFGDKEWTKFSLERR
ncbi:MAG: hypothetical protein AABW48_01815 [Nanoarchaeota archaeon]